MVSPGPRGDGVPGGGDSKGPDNGGVDPDIRGLGVLPVLERWSRARGGAARRGSSPSGPRRLRGGWKKGIPGYRADRRRCPLFRKRGGTLCRFSRKGGRNFREALPFRDSRGGGRTGGKKAGGSGIVCRNAGWHHPGGFRLHRDYRRNHPKPDHGHPRRPGGNGLSGSPDRIGGIFRDGTRRVGRVGPVH